MRACVQYLLHYGTDAQKQKYLPKLATGECIGAIAMTEPGAGSDLQGMKTAAVQKTAGGDYVLNGSKTYITNGGESALERVGFSASKSSCASQPWPTL